MVSRFMKTRVLLVEGEDRYFLHNRAPLAKKLLQLGVEVEVLANDTGQAERISQMGIPFHPLNSRRGRLSPLRDLTLIRRLHQLQKERRPQLVHHFTLKPVLFGSFAARFHPQIRVVNSITGLGYLFTDPERNRLPRQLAKIAYRYCLNGPNYQTIVQNRDDYDYFVAHRLARRERLHLIRGSGVDCQKFAPTPEPEFQERLRVLFIGRLLGDKGVFEFLEAARLLHRPGLEFVLAGDLDPGHPTSLKMEQLQDLTAQGLVRHLGYSDDVGAEIRASHVVVLPSYREGLPKVLLEAAACGRALVAADAPGSREVVIHEKTGLLVPTRDGKSLAGAIERLAADADLRGRLAGSARDLTVAEFSADRVVQQIVDLYRALGLSL